MSGPLRDWWLQIVRQAKPQHPGGSTQGYYILAPDGTGLAWDNFPPRMPQFFAYGVQLFRQSGSRGALALPADQAVYTTPLAPPPGTTVLQLYSRIRPLPPDAGEWNSLLGRDFTWLLASEVRDMIARSGAGNGEFPLPRTFTARLLVYHMVDNTRGQVWAYQTGALRGASLTARTLRTSGAIRTLALRGEYSKRDSHPPQWTDRGQEGTLEGECDLDTANGRVTRVRVHADSRAWSDATYDPRRPPRGRYPIQTAIVEATDALSRQIPPEPALLGAHYLRPEVPGW